MADGEILPSNYQIFHCDRGSRGGGVLVAVSNAILVRRLPTQVGAEMVLLELQVSPVLVVGCIYLPPSCCNDVLDKVTTSLRSLNLDRDILLLGDFNAPDVDWNSLSTSSWRSTALCDLVFDMNLVQLVSGPTHVHGNTLDLVFSNCTERVTVTSNNTAALSDHNIISLHVQSGSNNAIDMPPKFVYNYSQVDWMGLDSYLMDIDFSCMNLCSDVNILCQFLTETIYAACDQFIPVVKIPSDPSPPWFNSEIRHCLKKLHSAKRRMQKRSSMRRQSCVRGLEARVENMIFLSKESYINSLITSFSSNPKKLYRYIKDLKKSSSVQAFIDPTTSLLTTDASHIATCFNAYFNSTFTRSDYTLPKLEDLPAPQDCLSSISIDSSDVYRALCSLDPTKAMGCDNISARVLKNCATSLCEPVCVLFTHCLETFKLPDLWKVHKITAIPKSGDLAQFRNYRPISLLCILSKVLEMVVFKKVSEFILPRLSSTQFGFVPHRSSICQLLICYSKVVEAFEGNLPVDILFLDLRKAFDSVPHHELLYKLWRIGITGPLWEWFRDYLTGRLHYVNFRDCSSTTLPVISGVPQGSVLGPLLFLVYINDIPDCVSSSSVYLFADDTKLLKILRAREDTRLLQDDLASITRWSIDWKIFLNALKCFQMSFSLIGKAGSTTYSAQGSIIKSTSDCKDLGICITNTLSWSKHINYLCTKAYRSFHVIKRNIPLSSSVGLRKRLYMTLVRCHFSYCSQLWRPMLFKDMLAIERVQRRASKFILQGSSLSYKDRLVYLNLLPLSYWLELLDILFMVRCLLNPPSNLDIFEYVSFADNSTRAASKRKLAYKYHRTTTGRHFYFARIVGLWNTVPEISLDISYERIKARLEKFFWNKFINTFDENDHCTYNICCPCSNCHLKRP